jgi:Lon-like ATP-dependent protease
MIANILFLLQFIFTMIIGLYFFNMLKSSTSNKMALEKESKKEYDKLKRMRSISLTEPLSEKARPCSLKEVIGQEDAIKVKGCFMWTKSTACYNIWPSRGRQNRSCETNT